MKTKELIEALQKADPSGEVEVVANGVPIYFVEDLPAFYDGPLHMLIQDKNKNGYNIIGYKITPVGRKIMLHVCGLEDFLWDRNVMHEGDVDLSELNDGYIKSKYQSIIKEVEAESEI